jgi:hypothetical protein
MSEEIIPYLPALMNKLVTLLESSPRNLQILATNCIGSAAHSAEEKFLPYFQEVAKRLHVLMGLTLPDDLNLRVSATDAMGAVANAVGKDTFRPYLMQIMELAVSGMKMNHSRITQAGYVLFGVLGRVFEEEFSPFLVAIVPPLIASCNQQEKEFNTGHEFNEDEDSENDGEEFNINSGIADEKECSIDTLGELFTATRGSFLPYLHDVINSALSLLEYYHDGSRVAAIKCLLSCFSTVYSMANAVPEWDAGLPLKAPMHENVANIGKLVMNGVLLMLAEEEERY